MMVFRLPSSERQTNGCDFPQNTGLFYFVIIIIVIVFMAVVDLQGQFNRCILPIIKSMKPYN